MTIERDHSGYAVATPRAYVETFPGRRAWLAGRRAGIGSSDAPALFGLTPQWSGAYTVWGSKVHGFDPPVGGSRIAFGVRFEDPIAEWAAEDYGYSYAPIRKFSTFRHRKIGFLQATPDRLIMAKDIRGPGVAEIKTDNVGDSATWRDGAPLRIEVQLRHQMLVTGLRWGVVIVLLRGPELRAFEYERSARFERLAVRKFSRFWFDNVEKKKAPPIDGSPGTAALVRALYPTENGVSVTLPEESESWRRRYHAIGAKLRSLSNEREEIKSRFIGELGENSFGLFPDGRRASFKTSETGRRLYVPKPRGE